MPPRGSIAACDTREASLLSDQPVNGVPEEACLRTRALEQSVEAWRDGDRPLLQPPDQLDLGFMRCVLLRSCPPQASSRLRIC